MDFDRENFNKRFQTDAKNLRVFVLLAALKQ